MTAQNDRQGKVRVLELFSGSKSFAEASKRRGHETFTVDLEPKYSPDLVKDILAVTPEDIPFTPDIIWASPPCTGFSVASIGTHWGGGHRKYVPKTSTAMTGVALVKATISLIHYYQKLNPRLLVYIENPRGVLRKLGLLDDFILHTVTYCQYGEERMKPTDIWTNDKKWRPKPMCKNGDKCHIAAPRGSKTGTQGRKNAYDRSKVPSILCEEIL